MGGIAVLAVVLVSAQGVKARILGGMPPVLVSCSCSASRHRRQRDLRPGSGLPLHAMCLIIRNALTRQAAHDGVKMQKTHSRVRPEGGVPAVFRMESSSIGHHGHSERGDKYARNMRRSELGVDVLSTLPW